MLIKKNKSKIIKTKKKILVKKKNPKLSLSGKKTQKTKTDKKREAKINVEKSKKIPSKTIKKKSLKKDSKKDIKKKSLKNKKIDKKNVLKSKRSLKNNKNYKKKNLVKLEKDEKNPIMIPRPYSWESQAVFNPGAIFSGEKIHLFYRALGDDGISRIGYASSSDGLNFRERLYYPIYFLKDVEETKKHWPFTSPARPFYDRVLYSSGGGWGGCEDPRAVLIDGRIYLTLNIFNGWNFMRVAVISIKEEDLLNKKWNWSNLSYLSHPGDRQKNWVLFPEKINGKFVVLHNIDKGDPDRVFISYVNNLSWQEMPTIKDAPDPQSLPDHFVAWHKRTRSAASPPIKTKEGWLLLYHAMDKDGSNRYKLGAMLLDLSDPSKVICRSENPILEPEKWYENDWKPGIIYANGSVVVEDRLFVYYGGGDKYIGVASIKLDELLESMKKNTKVTLTKNNKIKI